MIEGLFIQEYSFRLVPLEAHLAVPQGTFPTNVCMRGAEKRGASETVFHERVFYEI
jgi:hypothetical protein